MSTARRLLFGALTVAGSVLLFTVVLELGLRAYDLLKAGAARRALPPVAERVLVPSEDPELPYELNPGFRDNGFAVNSLGLAGEETTREKPQGTFRIAFVGDSITCNFGHRPRNEIYLRILERELNRRAGDGTRYECLNFGVNGYGVSEVLRSAETKVPPFDPDVLVVQLGVNDPYPSDSAYGRFAPPPLLRSRSFLWRRIDPERFWGHEYVERKYDRSGLASLRDGMERVGALQARVPVVAVFFPYLQREAYAAWGFDRYHDAWSGAAGQAGVELVDLKERFDAAGLIDDRWPKDPIHPPVTGHELAAAALLEALEARGLLP
jgi:lysophospholipase L1-like esterase